VRILAGVAYLDAHRSGELVDRGIWSREAVGLPEVQAMAGATWTTPWIETLSLDGQVNHTSDRRARSTGALRTDASTTVDVGLRQVVDFNGRDVVVRARVLNLFDEDGWVASRTETLDRPSRRGLRLSLSSTF
jgi:iron complex outermembrane recepter protein